MVAGSLLLATLPIIGLAALLVRITSPGPAFFVQTRVGYRGLPLRVFKIRTMIHGADEREASLTDANRVFFKPQKDPRITPVGRWLRRLSVDELPQLLNVLRGEMSVVGPRPLLTSDYRNFPRDERILRFAVKPGLTGLWQVSGRSLCSDEQRLRLDLEYAERWSLAMDARILWMTIPVVLSGRGAT